MMIRIDDNILNTNFIKGVRLKSREGIIKIYFSDRTAKTFAEDYRITFLLDQLHEEGFFEFDGNYINPSLLKGFENLNDGRVKFYFPDTTALTLYMNDDEFEELVQWFRMIDENQMLSSSIEDKEQDS